MRRPASSSPTPWPAMRAAVAPGVSTADLDAIAEEVHPGRRRHPVLQGLPGLPGLDLLLRQRPGRARHPQRRQSCAPATSSPSTAAPSSTAGTATPRSPSRRRRQPDLRRLVDRRRGRDVGRHRRRRPRRPLRQGPPHRHLLRDPVRGAQGRPLRHRRRLRRPRHRQRHAPGPARGKLRPPRQGPRPAPRHGPRHRADDHQGQAEVAELDDGWTVVTVDGSIAAHVEHTMALCDDGVWVLTAPDGGRARLGELVTARQQVSA